MAPDTLQAPFSPLAPNPRSRGRITHRIRPNHRNYIPTQRVYVDTEAVIDPRPDGSQRQTLWFGYACFERTRPHTHSKEPTVSWLRFTDAAAFWERLESFAESKHVTYIYAHNWFYDLAMLSAATMAERFGWTAVEYVTGNHLLWLTLRKGDKTLKFIDTLNYFAMSLAKLGYDIGVQKMVTYTHPNPVEWWYHYCQQDVEVIRAAMHHYFDLVQSADLGAYKPTLAGQAYAAWRHRFMTHPVVVTADPELEALERSAYHGGRSEVFYDAPIRIPVSGLDVNSMYPWVMHEEVFPAVKVAKGSHTTIADLSTRMRSALAVARVAVHTDAPVYPYATTERVIFPVGSFVTTLSTPELQYALVHGHLRHVYEWATYKPAPLFRDYVETLYGLRKSYRDDGNPAFAFLVKILLNSLYGKFGQRGFVWQQCPHLVDPPLDDWTGNCETDGPVMAHRKRFGVVWHREMVGEAFESIPAIAAHVTAYARMALWQLKETAGHENVYYCDTDSLYVNEAGKERLASHLDAARLGGLKVESISPSAHFRAPKDYVLAGKVRIKGIRTAAHRLADNLYEQVQFASYDQTLAAGQDGVIVVRSIQKRLARDNRQSRATNTGWRTPYRLAAADHSFDRLPWEFQLPAYRELRGADGTEGEQ